MERSTKRTLREGPPGSPAHECGASGSAPLFTERYYFPNFDVAVAELLAGFGSNVAALTVAVIVRQHGDGSLPPAQRRAQEKVCVPFLLPVKPDSIATFSPLSMLAFLVRM